MVVSFAYDVAILQEDNSLKREEIFQQASSESTISIPYWLVAALRLQETVWGQFVKESRKCTKVAEITAGR